MRPDSFKFTPLMKYSNSYYTAKNSRITGSDKTKNIAISAILMNSYKEKEDILQSAYTAQNRSIAKIGMQYIQGWSCRFAPAPSGETVTSAGMSSAKRSSIPHSNGQHKVSMGH